MRETRKTIIVASLAAALLHLEAQLPLVQAKAILACVKAGAVLGHT